MKPDLDKNWKMGLWDSVIDWPWEKFFLAINLIVLLVLWLGNKLKGKIGC